MRFYVKDKTTGENIRSTMNRLAELQDYITIANVYNAFGLIPEPEMKVKGWYSREIKGKIRLRETKAGFFLYIPKDPVYLNNENIKTYLLYPNGYPWELRRCVVISRPKKGVIKEEKGWYHTTYQSIITKGDGLVIASALSLVEMEDGTFRNVKPTNIRFTDTKTFYKE